MQSIGRWFSECFVFFSALTMLLGSWKGIRPIKNILSLKGFPLEDPAQRAVTPEKKAC